MIGGVNGGVNGGVFGGVNGTASLSGPPGTVRTKRFSDEKNQVNC